MTVMLYRGLGHPWTCAPGWDQLFLGADDAPGVDAMIADAEAKFWKVWFRSEPTNRVHMFKPTGATADWKDISWQGTPRAHGHQFKVGDEVYTDFAKKITRHKVTAIELRKISQTGVMLRVTPFVPGAGYVEGDRGAGSKEANSWIDSAWFRKVP
jgi:hypothetical protein